MLKRGIYHNGSRKHLHRYCTEFEFRYNTRDVEDGGPRGAGHPGHGGEATPAPVKGRNLAPQDGQPSYYTGRPTPSLPFLIPIPMVQMPEGTPSERPSEGARVRFHYLKSNLYRVVHVDGAYGGVSMDGTVQMQFYSERLPIPDITVHPLLEDGTLGEEIRSERVGRDGIVREVEIGAVFDLETARSLVGWLEDKIRFLEQHTAEKE